MDLGKEIDFKSFYEDGHAQEHHLLSVPMHREEKNRKTKGRKRTVSRTYVKMPEKKRHQVVKAIYDKEGVTSKKLAANLNVDKFFVDRTVREAAVMTYRRAIGPEFSPELEQRQKRGMSKMGQTSILSPSGVELDPLAVP